MIEDTYGLQADDLSSAERLITTALNCVFTLCENDSRGGDYFRFDDGNGENIYLLQNNFIAEENVWREDDFRNWAYILYATQRTEGEAMAIREKLLKSGAKLLRSC